MKYTLEGLDGNAFNIMGYVKNCLKREYKPKDFDINFKGCPLAEEYGEKALKAKDYQEFLCISQDYIDLANGVKK